RPAQAGQVVQPLRSGREGHGGGDGDPQGRCHAVGQRRRSMSDPSGLRLMGVHAHADDETITMGGLYATCADRGIATCNICCTDGKLATIYDPTMPEETTRPRLTEIREAELQKACGILGVKELHFLRYGDSGMAG